MKETDILNIIENSSPMDYTYDDKDGSYFYKLDINLRLQIMREDGESTYNAEWTSKFADKKASVEQVNIYYLNTLIKKIYCVWVDGSRHFIPEPRCETPGKNPSINKFEHKIGLILNHPLPFGSFDQALQKAGIKIRED